MYKTYAFLILLLLFNSPLNQVNGQCGIDNFHFRAGEKLYYDAVYNWGFIWVNAGKVDFSVDERLYNGQKRLYLKSYGTSLKNYDWFFKVRDLFHSYVDKNTLAPYWFERKTFEGGYAVHNKYNFNYNDSLIYSKVENSDQPYKEDTLKLEPCTFDVLSAIYYARNLTFDGVQIGDTIPVRSIIDNNIYDLYIRYLGEEDIETRDDKIYSCIKFSALLVEGTIFKGGEDLIVWVTNDKNRVPVLVEAKILVGSVKAVLKNYEGTIEPIQYRKK